MMDTNSPTVPLPPMDTPRRPRGRPPSRSWAFFTTFVEPQKQPSAVCRHCNQLVYHRQKWGQARTHLMKCSQFLRLMETLPANEVPAWYIAETSRRQHVLNRSKAAAMNCIPGYPTPIRTPSAARFKSSGPISVTMMPHIMEIGDSLAPQATVPVDLRKVEENVAMHLLTTVSMETLMEGTTDCPFLLQAFQACNQQLMLPNKEKVMTELLDCCLERVKERVEGFLQSGLLPVALSVETATVQGSENDAMVCCYMATLASSEKYPMYLESVQVPSRGDEKAGVEWRVRDVIRVVKKVVCPVAGLVMPCSSLEGQRTRDLLEKHFPAMYFHGCMRDALWSLLQDIFTASDATNSECGISVPFVEDLQQLALQCKDLEFFLPIQEKKFCFGEAIESSIDVMHVTVRRRLTITEAFTSILQAEHFLDVDNVLNQLFPLGSNGNSSDGSNYPANIAHLQSQLIEMLRCPEFQEKLRKFLEVLRPICKLLELLGDGTDATSLLLSEVHSSFSRLAQQFASSTLLLPEEKGALQQLVQQRQANVLGSVHLLANLLDPVLLGENVPVDTIANAEQKLMASLYVDGTSLSESDHEALCAQYMDFKKFALNQKTNKAETLEFRTLKERKRCPLQFWFTDGAKWPVLQAIACRIFVIPVCAARSAHVVSKAGGAQYPFRNKSDFLTCDKLVYVRVNTHQLNLAEVAGSSLATVAQKPQSESIANDITASMVV